jgi:RNA polymerase sigma-70 factor, ECF subfamily
VELLFAAIGLRSVAPLRASAAVADAELVSRFQGGDRRAFDAIVMRYQARIYSLCFRWLSDAQAAEEQAQDVFVAAFRALGNFRNECSLSTWLFRIAVNHCRNQRLYRMRRAYGRHETFDAPREDDEAPMRQLADEDAPLADRGLHSREAGSLVQAALAELDEEHRQILILRDVEDLAYEEIADILDLPRGTVKSRIHRARAELAQKLARRVRAADVL